MILFYLIFAFQKGHQFHNVIMNEQKSEDKIKQDENKYNEGGSQLDCIEFKYCADELEFSKIEWPNDGISFMKSKVRYALTLNIVFLICFH